MKRIIGLALFCLCTGVYGADQCTERAKIVGSMVVTKNLTIEALKEKPVSGPMGEVWRHLMYFNGRDFEKFGDDREHVVAIAKLIEQNSFSKDWRIDLLIFREYFQGVCEAGFDILKISPIDVKAMSECFGDSPPGKENYPQCIRELINRAK